MTALAYTTGNPANLTGGATASMNDIQGPFTDLRTYINGASIADTQLESPLSATWRTVFGFTGSATPSLVAGTNYYFAPAATASGATTGSTPSGWLPTAADVAVGGRTTRLRLSVMAMVNGTPPAVNLTWGLYPVTVIAGGANLIALTLGAAVATAALNAPLSGTGNKVTSASFDLASLSPTTTYVPGIAVSAPPAANSMVMFQYFLEVRQT